MVLYGGYGVTMPSSQAWNEALADTPLFNANLGYLFAVQGPDDSSYANKNICNTCIAKQLVSIDPDLIIVAAHSSGFYVAVELLH